MLLLLPAVLAQTLTATNFVPYYNYEGLLAVAENGNGDVQRHHPHVGLRSDHRRSSMRWQCGFGSGKFVRHSRP